ncbi:MAG TPA: DoxX family protein [Vicinamibacterales bacterium]|nr:DoxX family protein [Vicinamibacterales bacterium]
MMASEPIAGGVEETRHRSARTATRLGIAFTSLAAIFLAFDTVLKVLQLGPAVEGTVALGYPLNSVRWIGVAELTCLALYLTPRTSVMGALLLTGYLGGATATHVRIASPLFTHILFPTYVALFVWGGLYLRESRLRDLLPLRRGGRDD